MKRKTSQELEDQFIIKEPAPAVGYSRGVVGSMLRRTQNVSSLSPAKIVDLLHEGFSSSEIEVLQESLGIPLEKLLIVLGISKSTWHRRRKLNQRLDTLESDRVLRIARLMRRATDVFESEAAAREWLSTSQQGLGGVAPLDFAQTEVGAREVEDLLGRIEYSVYV